MDDQPPMKIAVVPVTPFQQNCSILWCTATMKGAVVDPGGEVDRILATAQQHGVSLEKVIVTHGHLDHCGSAGVLADRLGIPVEGPQREDEFWITDLERQGQNYGFTEARTFAPTRWLEDGDTVTVGDLSLDILHCPGHTPGHVVLFHEPSRFAVVGDVLFKGSIGRSDLPRGNGAQLVRSIRDKLWPLGEDVTFLPGHGELSTFGHERKVNPFVSDMALAMWED